MPHLHLEELTGLLGPFECVFWFMQQVCSPGVTAQRNSPVEKAPSSQVWAGFLDASLVDLSVFTQLCHILLSGSSISYIFFYYFLTFLRRKVIKENTYDEKVQIREM